jgi:cell pole-organizing protein PopZ
MNNQDNASDMSMEEILSSIRRYVNNDESSTQVLGHSQKSYEKKMPIFENESISEANVVNTPNTSSHIPEAKILEPKMFNMDEYDTKYVKNHNQNDHYKEFSPFGKLEREFESDIKINAKPNTHHNIDVEKFLSDLIRPMIQKWLDEKLLTITEQMVQKEIEKIKNQK